MIISVHSRKKEDTYSTIDKYPCTECRKYFRKNDIIPIYVFKQVEYKCHKCFISSHYKYLFDIIQFYYETAFGHNIDDGVIMDTNIVMMIRDYVFNLSAFNEIECNNSLQNCQKVGKFVYEGGIDWKMLGFDKNINKKFIDKLKRINNEVAVCLKCDKQQKDQCWVFHDNGKVCTICDIKTCCSCDINVEDECVICGEHMILCNDCNKGRIDNIIFADIVCDECLYLDDDNKFNTICPSSF